MKLTEALAKSNVVRRASEPEIEYQVEDNVFVHHGSPDQSPVKLGYDAIAANDWQFRKLAWIGTKAKKEDSK